LTPNKQKKLQARISAAGEDALAKRKFVTPIDMLVGIGWLTTAQVEQCALHAVRRRECRARLPYPLDLAEAVGRGGGAAGGAG
jgi:hypothetical protein